MDRKNKFLFRQLRVCVVIIKRMLSFLQAASFLSVLFLFFCFAFIIHIRFIRDQISSTYSTSLHWLSNWIGRSSMFLLCNGIVVIVVLCSSSSPATTQVSEQVVQQNNHVAGKCEGHETTWICRSSESAQDCAEEEQKKADDEYCFGYQYQVIGEEEMHKSEKSTVHYCLETEHLVSQFDDRTTKAVKEKAGARIIEDDAGVAWCLLSRDELNKRCDDFIKKMKEEIKCEQRRRLLDFVR